MTLYARSTARVLRLLAAGTVSSGLVDLSVIDAVLAEAAKLGDLKGRYERSTKSFAGRRCNARTFGRTA